MHDASPAQISDPAKAPPLKLRSPLAPNDLRDALTQAGRRGKLHGYEPTGPDNFRLDCDAVPFEYELRGSVQPEGEGSLITLRARRRPLMPTVFAATLIFTVWPGVWLTDSLIDVYWSTYARWGESMPWLTYAWYLPITALPLPWLWRSLTRKSAAMAGESVRDAIGAVRAVAGAEG